MILTGICKEAFEKWLLEQKFSDRYLFTRIIEGGFIGFDYSKTPDKFLTPLIIDFFDSVGVYIEIGGYKPHLVKKPVEYWYNIHQENVNPEPNNKSFKNRNEATEAAIKKADEIYNLRK